MLLTSKLKAMHVNAEMVPEYARTYIVQNGGISSLFEQFVILRQQCAAEEDLLSRHDVVVCDSASFLCYIYARRLAGELDERKANALSLLYRDVIEHAWTYGRIYFVRPGEVGVLDDGVRVQTVGELPAIAAAIRGFLDLEGVPYKVLNGSPEERVAVVLKDLEEGGGLMGSFRVSKCPKCGGRKVGRVSQNTYFCADCFLEIELRRDGAVVLYRPTEDGERKQVRGAFKISAVGGG